MNGKMLLCAHSIRLYELQQSEKNTAMVKYNEAWTKLVDGDFIGAEVAIHEHLKDVNEDKHAMRLLEIIQKSKEQNKSYVNIIP